MTEDKLRIVQSYVPVIHELKINEAEDRSVVNKINVTYVNYELTALENAEYLSFNEQFKKILVKTQLNKWDKMRLNGVQRRRKLFLQSLNSSKEATRCLIKKLYGDHSNKILIFCGTTEQADKVCKFSFHGKNESHNWLDKFNDNEVRVLSVVSKIDRGLNIDGVNNIIFESPTKSKTKTMQRSGRARRLGVDEITNCYFMIPYYRDRTNNLKPTVVMDYVLESAEDLDLANANILNIKI
jgi:superfamily II DNA or RNA helicase